MVAAKPFVEGTYGHAPEIENVKNTLEYSSGVDSGMAPTQRAAGADMSVDIAAGYFWIKGTRYTYAGGNRAVDAADATNPRWDTIYFQSDGIHYTAGTPSEYPAMLALPASSTIVAAVYVAANDTEITDGEIRDERVLVNFGAPVGSVTGWLKDLAHTPALPSNWVECNGQVLSDAASPYNGDTLPNLNASGGGTKRFLRGSTTSGTTGGEDTHALIIAELAAHTHTFNSGASAGSYAGAGSGANNSATSSTGSGTAHENRPPFYEVVWIMRIK